MPVPEWPLKPDSLLVLHTAASQNLKFIYKNAQNSSKIVMNHGNIWPCDEKENLFKCLSQEWQNYVGIKHTLL